jgi:tetratricopeptide (TPR) repeat protein
MRWIPALVLLAACGTAIPEGSALYAEGEVDRARETFEDAAAAGHPSGTLLYDLGNARYREGDIARAIAAWRAARALKPRDAELVHNLAFARGELEGVPDPAPPPQLWLDVATPGELGGVGLLSLGAATLGAWWRRLRPPSTPHPAGTPWPWVSLAAAGLILGGVAVSGQWAAEAHPIAVVVDADVAVRDAAQPEAPSMFRLPGGTEVRVERPLAGFILVVTGDDRRGWIPADAVVFATP